jgi:hypothetical protein
MQILSFFWTAEFDLWQSQGLSPIVAFSPVLGQHNPSPLVGRCLLLYAPISLQRLTNSADSLPLIISNN